MTYVFLVTSIVAWTLLLFAHRRHVRAMRAQSLACIRRASDACMRGWFCGLRWTGAAAARGIGTTGGAAMNGLEIDNECLREACAILRRERDELQRKRALDEQMIQVLVSDLQSAQDQNEKLRAKLAELVASLEGRVHSNRAVVAVHKSAELLREIGDSPAP